MQQRGSALERAGARAHAFARASARGTDAPAHERTHPHTVTRARLRAPARQWALRNHAALLVRATARIAVGAPLLVALVVAVSSPFPSGVFAALPALGWAAFVAWLVRRYAPHLAMCERLFTNAAAVLNDQPGIVAAALGVSIGGAALAMLLGAAIVAAQLNGRFVVKMVEPDAAAAPTPTSQPGVVYPQAHAAEAVPVCTYEVDAWAKAYTALAALVLSWASLTIAELRRWVTASVAAQWWEARFSAASAALPHGASARVDGAVRLAVWHALGAGAGTLAFAGAVLAVLERVKRAGSRKRGGGGRKGGAGAARMVLWCVFMAIKWLFAEALEYLTATALSVAAITGAPLVAAGRRAVGILRPHLGAALVTWTVPASVLGLSTMTLALCSSTMAAVWAFSSGSMLAALSGWSEVLASSPPGQGAVTGPPGPADAGAAIGDAMPTVVGILAAFVVFLLSLLLNMVVLSFFANIVLGARARLECAPPCDRARARYEARERDRARLAAVLTSRMRGLAGILAALFLIAASESTPEDLLYARTDAPSHSGGGEVTEKALFVATMATMVPEETRKERNERIASQTMANVL